MTANLPRRRGESRSTAERSGQIKLGLFKSVTCQVADLSSSGAQLTVPSDIKLPDSFQLSIKGTGKRRTYKCAKRWNRDNVFGVEFIFD